MKQVRSLSFLGQNIYCGIDVHKKDWSVCIRDDERELKQYTQPPDPNIMAELLNRNYPQANFHIVYEAGFCGYWIQRALSRFGFDCKIVHAADVPTTDRDRRQKTDTVDCRKLAKGLAEGLLTGIYIPDQQSVDDRSLVRARKQLVKDQTRWKNRILSSLHFSGITIPDGYKKSSHFSNRFINWLEQLSIGESAKIALQLKLSTLKPIRQQLLQANRSLRQLAQTEKYIDRVKWVHSVAGIGMINSMILITELDRLDRFKSFDHLCGYAGFKPDIYSSSEKTITKRITPRCNSRVREALVESAWKAITIDPALLMAYKQYKTRMHYNNAIIRVAKKLLSRIRYVLIHQKEYVSGVVQ